MTITWWLALVKQITFEFRMQTEKNRMPLTMLAKKLISPPYSLRRSLKKRLRLVPLWTT